VLRKCNLDPNASARTSDSKMLSTMYGTVQQKDTSALEETAKFMVSRTILKRAGGSHHTNGRSKKKVLNGKFHNSRSVGKARTRWEDVALRNALQVLGIREWRTRIRDREEWRCVLRAARAQKGLGHCCTHISVSEEAAGQSGLSSESLRHRPQCHLEQHCLLSGVLTSLQQVVGRYWVHAILRQDDSSV